MRSAASLLLLGMVAMGLCAARALGSLSEEQAIQAARKAAERAGGPARVVTERDLDPRGWAFTFDKRWWVGIVPETGAIRRMRDQDFERSEHSRHTLEASPSAAEIEAAALELLHKVFPGFDMAEFALESAKPRHEQARVEARWRRVIPECGFPGPGLCFVDFCWPDRAISGMGAECPPIPDEWRRPASIAAEQAEATARDALGDLRGGWLRTTKDYCVVDPRDDAKSRPAWNVTLLLGSRDKPEECEADRSVFVDPWSGDVVTIKECMGDRPVGTSGPVVASRGASRAGARTVGAVAAHSWPPWAGGGAAVVVIALGATVVCVRRRRA